MEKEFKIEGMSCSHCVIAVEKDLNKLEIKKKKVGIGSAPFPIPTINAVGVAKPIAQGQAIISTATKFIKAKVKESSPPKIIQSIKVTIAITITIGTKIAATLSANF